MKTKLSTRLIRKAKKLWGAWKSVVDWVKANALYVIALLTVMNAFGMIAPETATALRDQVISLLGV